MRGEKKYTRASLSCHNSIYLGNRVEYCVPHCREMFDGRDIFHFRSTLIFASQLTEVQDYEKENVNKAGRVNNRKHAH